MKRVYEPAHKDDGHRVLVDHLWPRGLAAFLILDQAGFVTGQNFIVDGGMTKKMIYAE